MMDLENEETAEDEAHYYAVLSDMAQLMREHGVKQVMMDLLEVSIEQDVVSSSINQLVISYYFYYMV